MVILFWDIIFFIVGVRIGTPTKFESYNTEPIRGLCCQDSNPRHLVKDETFSPVYHKPCCSFKIVFKVCFGHVRFFHVFKN